MDHDRTVKTRKHVPLYIRILIGVALGIAAGLILREQMAVTEKLGMLVIRLLKALATPLILFAVLDAFLRVNIPARKGARLLGIAAINATVAITIGLTLANTLQPGRHWQGQTDEILAKVDAASKMPAKDAAHASLNFVDTVSSYIPESLVEPFRSNSIISVVLFAVLVGVAMRRLKDHGNAEVKEAIAALERGIHGMFHVFTVILEWIIQVIPFAVFCIVGRVGVDVFSILGLFLGTILLGLFIHAFVYYSFLLRMVGRTSPVWFFRNASEPIVTAMSCGSSLATLPVTLRTLSEKLRISPGSSRLAACVGTNLNHDGIILYEAMAAVFMAQAFGHSVPIPMQITIAVTSLLAGIGIAGVAEAGLITLPLVLGAIGLPTSITAIVIPLVLPVDWIIGRGRAVTNVVSDMTVATLLDRLDGEPTPDAEVIDLEEHRPLARAGA